MKVKLERPLHAVRPGEIFPVVIPAGEIVEGRLAEIAIVQKIGIRLADGGVIAGDSPVPPLNLGSTTAVSHDADSKAPVKASKRGGK